MKPQRIEITSKTIIFTVIFLLSLFFVWQIKDLIFSLFIAFIISGALKPAVEFLQKKKLSRFFASFLVYIFFLFIIGNLFSLVIPPLIKEMAFLIKNLPHIVIKAFPQITTYFDFSLITQNLPNLTNNVIGLIKGIFSNIIFITSTLFFGFYLLIEEDFIEKVLINFYDEREAKRINLIVNRAQKRASQWFWGEVILMSIVALMTYVGLTILGMKYVLALAVLAGLLEVVPTFGPIISTIPAVIIGFSSSYVLGLDNIGLYFIVQQLENHLIVPVIMKRIVGLSPLITLIALIVGGKLAGILGVLLAVPATIFVETILIENQKIAKK